MKTYTRRQWGAKPPQSKVYLAWDQIDEIVIHYSGMMSDLEGNYVDKVRGIQNFHMLSRGWSDIAYNWLISRTGLIFEGRGWNVMSAATYGHNTHTQAICFLGGDKAGRDDVTSAGRRALSKLINDALKKKPTLRVVGHKDRVSTDCPGAELMAFIRQRGWEIETKWPIPLPKWIWRWNEWRLGEGAFKNAGPNNRKLRYKTGAPRLIMPWVWAWARNFDRNRKKRGG